MHMLPQDHRPYTDKYFLRTSQILKDEGLNPKVGIKITAAGAGKVAGLSRIVEVLQQYTGMRGIEAWVTRKQEFKGKELLALIKGHVQDIVELETLYLGMLSDALSKANGLDCIDYDDVRAHMRELQEILQVPITYFGARHYHWLHDEDIARAALLGGAVQTSTDAGSININKEGAGTMPHILVIVLAWKYGKAEATLKAAELFDKHMPADVPRVILVDTFAREVTDARKVAGYFDDREHAIRIDTCPESLGEGSTDIADAHFRTGRGLTIELVENVKTALMKSKTKIFLTGGLGNLAKAKAFADASKAFKNRTGQALFDAVGVGEVAPCISATADVFEVEGKQLAKKGRESRVDYSGMMKLI
jgi:nicotinate phosphoribosyltransferase